MLDEANKLFEEKKEQRIFTGIRPLYTSTKDNPYGIRIKIRMSDAIDLDVLRKAVDTTMQRYPYFCVKLQKKNGQYVYVDNSAQIVISNSLEGVTLRNSIII